MAEMLIERPSARTCYRLSHDAMATSFGCYFPDDNRFEATEAAQDIFEEIDRIEQGLSFFLPGSDVSRFNQLPEGGGMTVGLELLDCLVLAKEIHRDTQGAFDPTIGARLTGRSRWNQIDQGQSLADEVKINQGPGQGFDSVKIEPETFTLTKLHGKVQVDLGGIGKGYALDRAGVCLSDRGLENVLIHSGQSTLLPLGSPRAEKGWPMRLLDPRNERDVLGRFYVQDMAVSCSAQVAGAHILDPVTGEPADRHWGIWVVALTAGRADALSTAFMVMPADEITAYCRKQPNVAALLVTGSEKEAVLQEAGDWSPYNLEKEG